MAILIFPQLEKKILFLFIYLLICGISYLILMIINGIVPYDDDLFDSFCQFFIYIPYFIYIFFIKKVNKNNELVSKKINNLSSAKFNIKDYFLFIFLVLLNIVDSVLYVIYESLNETLNLCSRFIIQMLVLLFLSKCFSKFEYHRHQLVSQIIVSISSAIIDTILIFNNKKSYDIDIIIPLLLALTIEIIIFYYKKYLFETKLFSIPKISFLFGSIKFFSLLILDRINIDKFLCKNNEKCLKFIKINYDKPIDILILIFSFFLISLFFFNVHKVTCNFSLNHLLICYSLFKFFENFKIIYNYNILYIIIYCILFIVIIMNLLVYVEILEYNFCKLNQNTRRNIIARERTEIMDISPLKEEGQEKKQREKIEIDGYYFYKDEEEEEDININFF